MKSLVAYQRLLARAPSGAIGRIARVTETFFTEVGVLLFVFPVLDVYVQSGMKAITRTLILGSLFSSFASYAIAAGLSVFTKERGD